MPDLDIREINDVVEREFTREFLELLWVLEKTIELYPKQKDIFERVLASPLYTASELPPVPDRLRKGPTLPKVSNSQTSLFDLD